MSAMPPDFARFAEQYISAHKELFIDGLKIDGLYTPGSNVEVSLIRTDVLRTESETNPVIHELLLENRVLRTSDQQRFEDRVQFVPRRNVWEPVRWLRKVTDMQPSDGTSIGLEKEVAIDISWGIANLAQAYLPAFNKFIDRYCAVQREWLVRGMKAGNAFLVPDPFVGISFGGSKLLVSDNAQDPIVFEAVICHRVRNGPENTLEMDDRIDFVRRDQRWEPVRVNRKVLAATPPSGAAIGVEQEEELSVYRQTALLANEQEEKNPATPTGPRPGKAGCAGILVALFVSAAIGLAAPAWKFLHHAKLNNSAEPVRAEN